MAERMVSPTKRIEIRYEDLCESPGLVLQKLVVFLGLPFLDLDINDLLASIQNSPLSETFRNVSEQTHHQRLAAPLNSSQTGRYKRELSEDDVRRIEAIVQNGMLSSVQARRTGRSVPGQRRPFFTRQMILNLVKRGLSVSREN
ncbi:MAG: sulfotransferase domain-containing protein [Planctomycetaceae bacterium]